MERTISTPRLMHSASGVMSAAYSSINRRALRVKQAGMVALQFVSDFPDGNLFIADGRKHVPFEIKRVFFINCLANPKAIRGKHAHKTLEQIIFCVAGSFVVHLDDGKTRQRITLNDPSWGIWLGPLLWHSMTSFSYDCVILVIASGPFDEADYIRDYEMFLRYSESAQPCSCK